MPLAVSHTPLRKIRRSRTLEHGKYLLRTSLTFGERVLRVHLFEDLDKWLNVERIERPVRRQGRLFMADE